MTEDTAERVVAAAIERIRAADRVSLRDRMGVAALLREHGDTEAADWVYDHPRHYARLISVHDEARQ